MKQLPKALKVLRQGGTVIVPTDTVYGFIADASNKKAVSKIYAIKKRPRQKPLPVFVASIAMAKEIAEIDDKQLKMLKKRWPGAYTFVLKRKPGLKLYGVDKTTIALRMPKNIFLLKLMRELGKPLAQTSANISAQETLVSGEQLLATFGKSKLVGPIVASKKPLKGKSSTIIDLTSDELTILR